VSYRQTGRERLGNSVIPLSSTGTVGSITAFSIMVPCSLIESAGIGFRIFLVGGCP